MDMMEVRKRMIESQPHKAIARGSIASFKTDVPTPLKMVFDLLPIQDLHGQAKPYPPGGGKNKVDVDDVSGITTQTQIGSVTLPAGDYCMSAYISNSGSASVAVRLTDMNNTTIKTTTYVASTETRAYATFTLSEETACKIFVVGNEAGYNGTVKKVQIEQGSTMTDFAPYENICPIYGHDGFTRTRTGKNLFDKTIGTTNGIRGDDGTHSSSSTSGYTDAIGGFEPETKYTFNGKFAGSNQVWRIYFLDKNKNWISRTGTISSSSVPYTRTTPANCRYVQVQFIRATADFNTIQIVKGESVGEYEAYKGTSIETTFPTPPGIVYGGHVTDNGDGTGTLTVTHEKIIMDGTIIAFSGKFGDTSYGSALYCSYLGRRNYFVNAISNVFVYSNWSYTNMPLYSFIGGSDVETTTTFILPSGWSKNDGNDWLKSLYNDGTPVEIIRQLETPQTYTLSLEIIRSLIGQNNIWVDNADEVTVQYWGH